MKYWFHSILDGILLIIIGLVIWLSNFGVIHISWRRDWPIILIVIGLIELIKYILKR